ncbi:MAG: hypothetical protein M1833_000145 [Piccolia ochrophora]|nr:MAG: hypothetical protein M1833_000145 [Piccolia ochrophora]
MSRESRSSVPSSVQLLEDRPEGRSRSFFLRKSKRARRHTSKLSLSSLEPSYNDCEGNGDKAGPSLDYGYVDGVRMADPHTLRKRTISEPFNFQHVTHTNSGQFPALDRTSQNELASEFSAVRAAQAPRQGLRGIKVEDLEAKRASVETQSLSYAGARSDDPTPLTTPSQSPRRSRYLFRKDSETSISSVKSFKYACAVDAPKLSPIRSLHSPTASINPPPRTSSRAAVSRHYDSVVLALPQSPAESELDQSAPSSGLGSPIALSPAGSFVSRPMTMAELDDLSGPLGMVHAVTTPDDSALQLRPPAFSSGTELADVPEEEESCVLREPSGLGHRPYSSGSVLRHTQSLSDMTAVVDRNTLQLSSSSAAESRSHRRTHSHASSEVVGSFPFPKAANPTVRSSVPSKRLSISLRVVDGCWEDDIDYCYQHAAEADCDFDWDRWSDADDVSIVEGDTTPPQGLQRTAGGHPDLLSLRHMTGVAEDAHHAARLEHDALQYPSGPAKPPMLIASSFAPNTDPNSLSSASTTQSEAGTPQLLTPSHNFSMGPILKYGTFGSSELTLRRSVLIPYDDDERMLEEAMYEEFLTNDDQVDHRLPLCDRYLDQSDSCTDSCRSSRTPLSKTESQESIEFDNDKSNGSQHCSIHSTISVPDLVPSRSRKEAFDVVAARLAKHVASLNTADGAASEGVGRASPLHRRCKSLAKDVGHQSILKHATSNGSVASEASDVTDASPRRERSHSDAGVKTTSRPATLKKMRSSSSMSIGAQSRSSRASYVVFPVS